MTGSRSFGAAAILSLMSATPVFAQAAIQSRVVARFYYPNNDVLNAAGPRRRRQNPQMPVYSAATHMPP